MGLSIKSGIFGDKTPKIPPKIYWGFIGVGDNLNFGVFWGFYPKETQISGIPRKSPFWWILSLVPYIWVLHQLGRACNHSSSVMLLLQGCKECIWTTRFLRKPHLHQSILGLTLYHYLDDFIFALLNFKLLQFPCNIFISISAWYTH